MAAPAQASPNIQSVSRKAPTSEQTGADELTWLLTFTESVTHVHATDFVVSGTTAALRLTPVAPDAEACSTEWDATLSGGDLAGLNETVTLTPADFREDLHDMCTGSDEPCIWGCQGDGERMTHPGPVGTNDNTFVVSNEPAPPATPVMSFASASATAGEGSGTLNVTVKLSPAPASNLTVSYSLSGTAVGGGSDYSISGMTSNMGTVVVASDATSATIPVAITDDSLEESDESVVLTLTDGSGYTVGSPSVHTLTIIDDDGGGVGDDDEPDDGPSSCTLAAPYWSGPTGGFTVRPAPGRTAVSVTCGRSTTEYMAEGGLVTRLVRSTCPGGLRLTGAAPGGWYWQHGERNAAAAPFVCSEALGGPRAAVPGGVEAEVTDNGTWFRHDTARLVGIVPHLAENECSEYVTPYWQGDEGVVVRPAEGRTSVRVRVHCGRTYSTMTLSAGTDGIIAELVRKGYCSDDASKPKKGRLTVTGAAPGGWYWISGYRNAAVAPLMCAHLLGGPVAVNPGGVTSRATDDGTYFSHDTSRLIGVVPHIASDRDDR